MSSRFDGPCERNELAEKSGSPRYGLAFFTSALFACSTPPPSNDIQTCEPACGPNATCVDAACGCDAGFVDNVDSCIDIDECGSENGGCGDPLYNVCTNNGGAAPACTDVLECAADNGGCDPLTTCNEVVGGPPTCSDCPTSYWTGNGGDAAGCVDVSECATDNGGCDPLTTCAEAIGGSPTCADCPGPYWPGNGGDPSGCTDVDECATTNGGCVPLTTCNEVIGGPHTCGDCPAPHWTGNGRDAAGCVDVSECATDNGGCDPLTTCTEAIGGPPTCGDCPGPYWTGNGSDPSGCTDVDECATDNGGCGDATFYHCTNNPGAPHTCADIDECAVDNGGCGDVAHATCTNVDGGPPICADIDECATDNGGCGLKEYIDCTNNEHIPHTCTDIDECADYNGLCGDPTYTACINHHALPHRCVDIDECANNNGDCGEETFFACTNTIEAPQTCADIDECAIQNGNCGDPTFYSCTNVVGAPPDCALRDCAVDNGGCGDAALASCTPGAGGEGPICTDLVAECMVDNGGCGDPRFFICEEQTGVAPTCKSVDHCRHGGFVRRPDLEQATTPCTAVNWKSPKYPNENHIASKRFALFWLPEHPEEVVRAAAPYLLNYLEQCWESGVLDYGMPDRPADHSYCINVHLNSSGSWGAGRTGHPEYPQPKWPYIGGPANAAFSFAYDDNIAGHSLCHEIFHILQTRPYPWEPLSDGRRVVEATAEWILLAHDPNSNKCPWVFTATPHLPLWTDNRNYSTTTPMSGWRRKYDELIFFVFMNDIVGATEILGDYWLEAVPGGIRMQEFLHDAYEAQERDLHALYADFAARNATFDYPIVGPAMADCVATQLAKPANAPYDFSKIAVYDETGSGGWVTTPAEMIPHGWGYNLVQVDVGGPALLLFEFEADAVGSEGTTTQYEGRLVRSRGQQRDYLDIETVAGVAGSIAVRAAAGDSLTMVMASVPERFDGFEMFPVRHNVTVLAPATVLAPGDPVLCAALGRETTSDASGTCGACLAELVGSALSNRLSCCGTDAVVTVDGICVPCPQTAHGSCNGHGSCSSYEACPSRCECEEGWYGEACETFQPCRNNSCAHGVCTSLADGFSCSCEGGFTGPVCDDHDPSCWQKHEPVACAASGTAWSEGAAGNNSCAMTYDAGTSSVMSIDCSDGTAAETGCVSDSDYCEDGCLRGVWLGFDLGTSKSLEQVRMRFGWFKERPFDVEIWTSDDPAVTPDNGAVLVASSPMGPPNYRCTTGEPCSVEVPDRCCPDGRDSPQDIRDVGSNCPKFNVMDVPPTSGRMVYVRMPHSRDPDNLQVFDVEMYERLCGS